MTIQDEALAGNVRNSLNQDKRVAGQAIAVRVVDGDVYIKGMVDTEEQMELVKLICDGIPGVRQVNVDELRVREVS